MASVLIALVRVYVRSISLGLLLARSEGFQFVSQLLQLRLRASPSIMSLLQLSGCSCGAHQIGLLLIKSGSMSRQAWRHRLDLGTHGLRAHII